MIYEAENLKQMTQVQIPSGYNYCMSNPLWWVNHELLNQRVYFKIATMDLSV